MNRTTHGLNNYLLAAVLWLSAVSSLSLSKSLGFTAASNWLERLFGGDLVMHLFWAGGLSFLFCRALPTRSQKPCLGLLSPVVLLLTAGCLAEELSQLYLPNRAFSWLDFSASYSGVVLGCLIARLRMMTIN